MAVADCVVGVALLMLGSVLVLGRERIAAGQRRRVSGRKVQPPMAWLVLGTLLALAGVILVVQAFA